MMKRHWPAFAGIAILIIGLFVCFLVSAQHTDGKLIYPIDDTYIHMAMARNFAEHQIWGGDLSGFSSTTSSPLYTFFLAVAYKVFGTNIFFPLVLNILFGIAICILLGRIFNRLHFHPFFSFSVITLIVLITPLWTLVYLGMEHTLHSFLSILFVYYAGRYLGSVKEKKESAIILLVTAPMLLATRYESLFILGIVVGMLCLKKEFLFGLKLFAAGCMPIILYGLLSVSKGWYFFPNSVLLKGGQHAHFSLNGLLKYLELIVYKCPHLYVLIFLLLLLSAIQFLRKKTFVDAPFLMAVITLLGIFSHLFFARIGWFYRYESYLIAVALFVIAVLIRETVDWQAVRRWPFVSISLLFLTALFLTLPLIGRVKSALVKLPFATKNIYEQQCQMAFFVREFYNDQKVAINDIGAVTYFSNADVFDLIGLMDMDIARAQKNKKSFPDRLYDLIKEEGSKIAIVNEGAFKHRPLPDHWTQVGRWQILNNVVCCRDTIAFYSLNLQEQNHLINCLQSYSTKLPADVVQSGLYMKQDE